VEEASPVLEHVLERLGIDYVAVVRECEVAALVAEEEWLHVLEAAAAVCGVADMANTHGAFESGKLLGVEDLGHKSQSLCLEVLAFVIDSDDATAFLPSVLEGVETIIYDGRCVRDVVHPEHTAFLMKTSVEFF